MRTVQSEQFASGFLSALEKAGKIEWDPSLHPRDIIGRFAQAGEGFGTPKGPVQTFTQDQLFKMVPKDAKGNQYWKGQNVKDIYTFHKFDPKETGLEHIIVRRTSETDPKPKKLYQFTDDVTQQRAEKKFQRAERMVKIIAPLRDRMDVDARRKDPALRQMATVAKLIDETATRIGGSRTEKQTGSVGASTLRVEHVRVIPEGLRIRFSGKSETPWDVKVKDPVTVKNIKEFMQGKKRGDDIFDKTDCDKVNGYIWDNTRGIGGMTAKDFRTFHGCRHCFDELERLPAPKTAKDIERNISRAVDVTASFLNHSTSICKKSYIDPRIISSYQQKWTKKLGEMEGES